MNYVPTLAFLKSLFKTPFNSDNLLFNSLSQKVPSELMKVEFYRPEVSEENYEILVKNYLRKEVKLNPELNIYSILYLYHKLRFMGIKSRKNAVISFINENKNGFVLQLMK